MTTIQTIDGVPRALLKEVEAYINDGLPLDTEELLLLSKLRALLDAPAVEADPIVEVLRRCLSEGVQPTFSGGDLKHLIGLLENKPSQPQGEPVAWLNVATGHVTTSPVVVMDWDDEKEQVQSLYTEQPAPVAMVLPERHDLPHRDEYESADQHAAAVGEAKSFNACLDEVARLNAKSL